MPIIPSHHPCACHVFPFFILPSAELLLDDPPPVYGTTIAVSSFLTQHLLYPPSFLNNNMSLSPLPPDARKDDGTPFWKWPFMYGPSAGQGCCRLCLSYKSTSHPLAVLSSYFFLFFFIFLFIFLYVSCHSASVLLWQTLKLPFILFSLYSPANF